MNYSQFAPKPARPPYQLAPLPTRPIQLAPPILPTRPTLYTKPTRPMLFVNSEECVIYA